MASFYGDPTEADGSSSSSSSSTSSTWKRPVSPSSSSSSSSPSTTSSSSRRNTNTTSSSSSSHTPSKPPTAAEKLLKFNVGGQRFVTSRSTLLEGPFAFTRDNMLSRLVANDDEGLIPAMRDEDGYIFIDRNGPAFGVLLDYLRTGQLIKPPYLTWELLEYELDFYGIRPYRRSDSVSSQSSATRLPPAALLPLWELVADEKASAEIWVRAEVSHLSEAILSAARAGKLATTLQFSRHMRAYQSGGDGTYVCSCGAEVSLDKKLYNNALFCKILQESLESALDPVQCSLSYTFYSTYAQGDSVNMRFNWDRLCTMESQQAADTVVLLRSIHRRLESWNASDEVESLRMSKKLSKGM